MKNVPGWFWFLLTMVGVGVLARTVEGTPIPYYDAQGNIIGYR